MEVHCVRVNSYVGKTAGDTLFGLEGIDSIEKEIKGRLVLVVDDIFDTGHTLEATIERLRQLGAGDVKSVVCLEKTRERDAKIRPDWVGFVIEDEFVIGYGLDFDGKYRNLDHIRIFQD
jgi:hypoxanthine phosphoribosyltransferase